MLGLIEEGRADESNHRAARESAIPAIKPEQGFGRYKSASVGVALAVTLRDADESEQAQKSTTLVVQGHQVCIVPEPPSGLPEFDAPRGRSSGPMAAGPWWR